MSHDGISWRSDFFLSGPGFANQTQSDPGFVNPVRYGPIQILLLNFLADFSFFCPFKFPSPPLSTPGSQKIN